MRDYRPRGMPRRYLETAPEIVRRNVVDILAIVPAAPLDFDVIFRDDPGLGDASYGLDFGNAGERGCHFYLNNHDMRAYRNRMRRRRVAWSDLPAATQRAIVCYLESE